MAPTGTVLLVNSFDGLEMYGDYLRANNLTVCDAAFPEVAFLRLDRIDPDVVITDFVFLMSAFDGPAFVRAVRARLDEATSIIVVSGFARQEDREQARAAGADLYLLKPALPAAVLYEVRRALILRRSGRRLPWNWRDAPSTTGAAALDRRSQSGVS